MMIRVTARDTARTARDSARRARACQSESEALTQCLAVARHGASKALRLHCDRLSIMSGESVTISSES